MLSPVTTEKSQGKSGWQAVSVEWDKTEAILQGAKQKHQEQEKHREKSHSLQIKPMKLIALLKEFISA